MGMIEPNMGTKTIIAQHSTGLANALFPATKQRVLAVLFGRPDRSFYAREVIGLVAAGSGAVQRELAVLTQAGLLTVKAVGNQAHYQANAESPIFAELRAIVQKTVGIADPIRQALDPVAKDIAAAFVYGSVAKQTDNATSDIDLLLLTEALSYGDVFTALEQAGEMLGRPVNPTLLTRAEFAKRLMAQESFLTRVLDQPKIWILGGQDDLPI
jgi:predicted nucleotidyltransferase